MSDIDDLPLPDFVALRAEWDRHQRRPHVRAWRFVRNIPWRCRAFVCRVFGHDWHDYADHTYPEIEYWCLCHRCGKEER